MPSSKLPDDTAWQFWARWLANQGVSTVVLFAILASGWYGGNYVVREAVPAHLRSIKEGYTEIEKSHREEREERDRRFSDEHAKDRELMRQILTRPEKAVGSKE